MSNTNSSQLVPTQHLATSAQQKPFYGISKGDMDFHSKRSKKIMETLETFCFYSQNNAKNNC